MMNPTPLGLRRTIRLLVGLTLLAWATQTLFAQWGYGGIIVPQSQTPVAKADPLTLELRSGISDPGAAVTLRDVCKWSGRDNAVLEPLAETVLKRLDGKPGVWTVTVADVRSALKGAGINAETVTFTGAASCAVACGEVSERELADAVSQPIHPAEPQAPAAGVAARVEASSSAPATQPVVETKPKGAFDAPPIAEMPRTSLKAMLMAELMEHLKLPADQIQVDFDPRDEPILSLTSPLNRFDIEDRTATTLGPVMWIVNVRSGSQSTPLTIKATARAWREQLVLRRPLSKGQTLMASDVRPARVLVMHPGESGIADLNRVVGKIATRDLSAGEGLRVLDLEGARVVQTGEFLTVSMTLDNETTVQTVARALDAGAVESTVRARNEATGDVYRVLITGAGSGQVVRIDGQDVASLENK